ncbi:MULTISPECIES: YciI family protein [Jannaschia]|nr:MULTISPECIES: YciI family protein [unclassified Jannaschia]
MPPIPQGQTLFVVDLHYVVPLDTVETHIDAHVDWLEACYARGLFLASGAKVPRTGGVIIATAASKAELEGVLDQDPFKRAGVAEYRVTEFNPSMTAPGLKSET